MAVEKGWREEIERLPACRPARGTGGAAPLPRQPAHWGPGISLPRQPAHRGRDAGGTLGATSKPVRETGQKQPVLRG